MEDFKVECVKEKPRTLEELFIRKYEALEKENKDLKEKTEMYEKRCDELEKTLEQIKHDFSVTLYEYETGGKKFISFSGSVWNSSHRTDGKYEYYKNLFNLKEKGEEEENEQQSSTN